MPLHSKSIFALRAQSTVKTPDNIFIELFFKKTQCIFTNDIFLLFVVVNELPFCHSLFRFFFFVFFVNTAITSGLFHSFLEYHSDFVENNSFIQISCVFCNIFNSLSTIRAGNSFDYEIQN